MSCRSRLALLIATIPLLGLSLSNPRVPLDEILSGGPPKDGIPALTDPEFVAAGEADYLRPGDRVLGVVRGGEAKAYPVRVLNWHELANDRVGGEDILVSYCPLCGSGMAFKANLSGERALFGVSGKLYNSNVLFYDKQTESLWSQMKMQAVTGPRSGARLEPVVITHTTWAAWRESHPDTRVLSLNTGHVRDYDRDPYLGYEKTRTIYFPVSNDDSRLPPKTWVVGVTLDGHAKAYSFESLSRLQGPLKDVIAGRELAVRYDQESHTARVEIDGNEIPSLQAYWFSWAAFHPDTALYDGKP